MIIDSTHNVKTNLHGSVEFSVSDDSAKIFSFLSNFLYKDKERSVMTELCSNALDAHKMVGKEAEPILVHLPTDLQHEFRVRDYGPGLSEAQVYQFLTKYGSSSKTGSNDFIGGFGIGSKSPAAVTDTWTINSHHSGELSSYLIHINDRGIPSINKLFAKPTTESGLEVIVPVKTTRGWHEAAERVFAHYAVMPIIKGTSRKISKVELKCDFFGLVKFRESEKPGRYTSDESYAILNNRSYSLDTSKFLTRDEKMFSAPPHFLFDVSALSVSLSREDLQYDSRTVDALKARYADVRAKLEADWVAKVSPAKTIFLYKMAAAEFIARTFIVPTVAWAFAKKAKDQYADKVNFADIQQFEIAMGDNESPVQSITKEKAVFVGRRRSYYGLMCGVDYDYNYMATASKSNYKNYRLVFRANGRDDILFVLRDVKDSPSRVKLALSDTYVNMKGAVLLDADYFNKIPDDFLKVHASTLAKVPQVKSSSRAKVVSDLYVLVKNHFEKIDEASVKTNKHIVCMRFKNANSSATVDDSFDKQLTMNVSKFYTSTQARPKFVYVKDGKDIPKYAITAKQEVERIYNELVSKKDEIVAAFRYRAVKGLGYHSFAKHLYDYRQFWKSNIPQTSLAYKIITELESIMISSPDLTLVEKYNILNQCGNVLNLQVDPVPVDQFDVALRTAYPLIPNYIDDAMRKHVAEYIVLKAV